MCFLTTGFGGEIEFIEDFSLATDRTVPLKQHVPGTEPYYYYHALHALQTEQFGQVEAFLPAWVQRHGETNLVREIRMRLALATYDKDNAKTLQYLRSRLGLSYPHQREVLDEAPNFPTKLDQSVFTRDALFKRVAGEADHLNSFEDSALEWLATQNLSPRRRRHLLQRLARPDVPNLSKLVVEDLKFENSGGFGSLAIHKQLLQSQLNECLEAMPELRNQGEFVKAYVTRLQPGPEEDWKNNAPIRDAYLDRLWGFVKTLAPAHNSLKAHVLYHQLLSERNQGKYNKARLIDYLKLPRQQGYVARKFLELPESRQFPVDLNADYRSVTLLPPVGNDEPLVRSLLQQFFMTDTNTKDFDPYIHDVYLKHLFAETKIVNGLGEVEQWASQLPPELYQQLKERIDIDFVETNKTSWQPDEPVSLELRIKNVSNLIVKVFEINTTGFYRTNLKEIDTDINLDGLVANEELSFTYNDSPLRLMTRKFDFPRLKKSGVYVIDFIGNGRSSRALIRKGILKHLVRITPAGQLLSVLNEKNEPVPQATVWLAGHEYKPDDQGRILIPFSTQGGTRSQPIVLVHGEFASLANLSHEAEAYHLAAGFYVDRESLLTRKTARLVIRPGLTVNGTPVSLKVLDEVTLTLSTMDHDQVASSQTVQNLKLFEDRETIHEFLVPPNLANLSVTLQAKIKNLSQGKTESVSASDQFLLNGINRTEQIELPHLGRFGDNYFLELLGRTGEPRVARPVTVSLKPRDFKHQITLTLKTDERGRVDLGPLVGIHSLTLNQRSWQLPRDSHSYPRNLHGKVGEVLTLPYLGSSKEVNREELSLLELRGSTFVADRFSALKIKDGLIHIEGLPAGDYDFTLKSRGIRIAVRITPGEKRGEYLVGSQRALETKPLPPVQVESLLADEKTIQIQLRNSNPFVRVHLFATRYLPYFHADSRLGKVRSPEPYVVSPGRAESVYLTGRNIGDEYGYIINRKYERKFPGNTLDRPSLLLNPWAVRSTETGEQLARGGDEFAAKGQAKAGAMEREALAAERKPGQADIDPANLDFLAEVSPSVLNLVPDKDGIVTVPRAEIGWRQHLHVVAIDPLNTTCRSFSLPDVEAKLLDLRQLTGLDPKSHFTLQKRISLAAAKQPFELRDIATSKFEVYDSLTKVFTLFATLSRDPQLEEFRFLLKWPTLKDEEKRTFYSKYACHELHFFLARKDQPFFQAVVKPYLANKRYKTFLDHWLLENDLTVHQEPWRHHQLNIVERILLGDRIAVEKPRVARHVADLFQLVPPNLGQTIHLFDTAVLGNALDSAEGLNQLRSEAGAVRALQLNRGVNVTMDAAPALGLSMGGGSGSFGSNPAAANAPMSAPAAPVLKQSLAKNAKDEQVEKAKEMQSMKRDGASRRFVEADRKKLGDLDADGSDKNGLQDSVDSYYDYDFASGRGNIRQLYRKPDPTQEWAENNYYRRVIAEQNAGLISVNAFWKDYANRDLNKPFQSIHLAEATRNLPEMLLALAVLDLPFESAKLETKLDGVRLTLTPANDAVVFHEELQPAAAPAVGSTSILVSQNFYRHGDRYRMENNEQVDKFITEEFLTHVAYGCQMAVTNPTSSRQKLSVLIQTPAGSIPVLGSQPTKTVLIDLQPYHTQTLDYYFYFPAAGEYTHFPVHIAKNEALLVAALPQVFHVVHKPTKIDTESWPYLSQFGTPDQVLNYLTTHNIDGLDLEKIAFRMRDKAFFEKTIALLTERHVYHATLWSYSLLHNLPGAAKEFLQSNSQLIGEVGEWRLASPLISIDPVVRRSYEHLDYKPLINARAHSLGKRRQILNDRFHQQYHRLLKDLSYAPKLTDEDWLAVTYYLLLQDRVDEASTTFSRVKADQIAERMQYDYCAAYLDFFTDDHAKARAIALKYANFPVDRWRNTFSAIVAQLDEAEGKGATIVDPEKRDEKQTQLAATEPVLDLKVEAKQIKLDFQNVKKVRVNYYLMDVELLFSRNPFAQSVSGQFAAIQPNFTQEIDLPANQAKHAFPLPDSVANKNVLVEVQAAGLTKSHAYYSHSLTTQVIENYGQIKVTHETTGKPVPKAYVKVYAKLANGQTRFYKDGYTDLRGRFDYASLSTNDLNNATAFAILILSDEFGATIREATPPKQ